MKPGEESELEDSWIDKLAAWDEALAKGESSTFDLSQVHDPDLNQRLNKGIKALQSLNQWRHKKPAPSILSDLDKEPTLIRDPNDQGLDKDPLDPVKLLGKMGRFHVHRELGRGGFGMVFLAFDPILHREIALKVPHATSLLSPVMRKRFTQEARTAARLNHPNIIAIHEAGQSGPIHFIAYAYSPGQTLSHWLKSQTDAVPFELSARLMLTLANAMAYAHDQKVVHRDLKPANILLEPIPRTPSLSVSTTKDLLPFQPKITDFGLAKSPGAPDCTRSGTILGTPSYMSPEQAMGQGQGADPAVDIYSLGAIFYELLTGLPPFRGESELDTLQKVRFEEPIAPRQLRQRIPKDLETICLKCLRKEPAHRYLSAHALAEDLQRYLRREAIHARPVSRFKKWRLWIRRHPATAGLTLALCFTLLLGVAGILWQWQRAEELAEQAVTERNLAMIDKQRAQGMLQQSHQAIKRLTYLGEELLRTPGSEQRGREILHEALKYYRELLKENTNHSEIINDTARTALEVARIQHILGQVQDAENTYLLGFTLLKDHLANQAQPVFTDQLLFGHLNANLAHFYRDLRKWEKAEHHYREAIAIFGRLRLEKATATYLFISHANAQLNLATVLNGQDRNEEALVSCQNALLIQEEAIRLEPKVMNHQLEKALNLEYMGTLLDEMKLPDQALIRLLEAHDLRQEILQSISPSHVSFNRATIDASKSQVSLGWHYWTVQQDQQAYRYYEQAADQLEKICQRMPHAPMLLDDLASTYHRLAMIAERQSQWSVADKWHRQALAQSKENLARFPKARYIILSTMKHHHALARHGMERISQEAGLNLCRDADQWVQPYLKQNSPDPDLLKEYARFLAFHAWGLEQAKQTAESVRSQHQCIALWKTIQASEDTPEHRRELAKAHLLLGWHHLKHISWKDALASLAAALASR